MSPHAIPFALAAHPWLKAGEIELQEETGDAHREVEIGVELTEREYRFLRKLLPRILTFSGASRIADFVFPTGKKITRRIRFELVQKPIGAGKGLKCVRTTKSHPIKGKKGKHIRRETERSVTSDYAVTFILAKIEKLGRPIPWYSKKRHSYKGFYKGIPITIALDQAVGLGKYSGFYMEIETIMPLGENQKRVRRALRVMNKLARSLVGEKRPAKISYRRMLMRTSPHAKAR